ncbi:MAG: EamA family transporter [Anaerolineales bacterium]|nr:MAG: EamA family transporter [Anaerolineales bacterium]
MPASLMGIFLALASAAVWGGGDFSGGQATRKSHQYQVLMLAALTGMVMLGLCALVRGEGLPSGRNFLWGALAGASGALGVAALYKALSMGNTASVAPTSAIICALIPVLYGLITVGLPTTTQLVGFVLAFIGIWLLSRSPQAGDGDFRKGLVLAFLSGIGFGGFFLFISFVEKGQVFVPILVARTVTLAIAIIMLRVNRLPSPGIVSNPLALLAGVLDTGGNILYLLATQLTRLDIAALLSSFYPASTVILARIILREKVSPAQLAGLLLCLLAMTLIIL